MFNFAFAAGTMPAQFELPLQIIVDLFNRIVPLLVVAIDRPLHRGDLCIADILTAGDIFLVPQQEVEPVLLANRVQQLALVVFDFLMVPQPCGPLV